MIPAHFRKGGRLNEPQLHRQYREEIRVSKLVENHSCCLEMTKKLTEMTPSEVPSPTPSEIQSAIPLELQIPTPLEIPSETPSEIPSETPSEIPSPTPSETPSPIPSEIPVPAPSEIPSETPAETPAATPSETPSPAPAEVPSPTPSPISFDVSIVKKPRVRPYVRDAFEMLVPQDRCAEGCDILGAGDNIREWVIKFGNGVGRARTKKEARMIAMVCHYFDPLFTGDAPVCDAGHLEYVNSYEARTRQSIEEWRSKVESSMITVSAGGEG